MSSTANESPVVLITGASSGLGMALAQRLKRESYRLVLTARPESLHRFHEAGFTDGEQARLFPLEVTNDLHRRDLFREVTACWGGIDILVNNAAVAYRTVTEHIDEAAWKDAIEVNCHAPIELIRLVLPRMRSRGAGRILNISSVGGMMAMPTMSLYSAGKFALEGATEALWYEVRPWNIHVSLVEPGFIHSESFRNTQLTRKSFHSITDDRDAYHAHYLHMASFIEKLMNRAVATPESIAERILRIMRDPHPPLRAPVTIDAHLFSLLRRLLPREVYHRLLYRMLPHVRDWGYH